jgi:hypothetical protein
MPKSLFVDELMETMNKDEDSEISAKEAGTSESENSQPTHPKKDIRSITQSPKFYLLNRSVVQKDLTAASPIILGLLPRLIPYRWKAPMGNLKSRDLKSLVWREDMPELVLTGLRRAAVKALKKACLKSVNVDDPHGVWRAVWVYEDMVNEKGLSDGLEQVGELEAMGSGGLLVLGSDTTGEGNAEKDVGGKGSTPLQSATSSLPDLITLPVQGSQVPLFDLRSLLAETDINELRQHHPRFQETALFFRPGANIPVDAMLALWKLKGYIMHDQNT